MGWLIALFALVLLGLLPIGIFAAYDSGGAVAALTVGFVRIPLYPRRKSAGKQDKKPKNDPTEKDDFESKKSKQRKKLGTLSDFNEILRLVLYFLSDFRRKLRIKNLEFKLILAGDDPCDLSVNYGRSWAALGNLMPQLERLFVIKKRNLQINCDYTVEEPLVEVRIDMTITLSSLLWILGYHGFRGLRKYNKTLK